MPETQIRKNSSPMFSSSNEVQVCQEEFLHWKGGQALEGASLGCGEVPIPEGVQGVMGCGTQGSGLVDKDGVWTRIGPDNLGGFSQPKCFYDSVILYISLNTWSEDTGVYIYKNKKVLFWKEFFSSFRHFKFWAETSLRSRPTQWGVTHFHVFVNTSKQTNRKSCWNRKFWSVIWSIKSKLLFMLLFMFVWRNLHHLSE